MKTEAKFRLGQKVFIMRLNVPVMQTVAAVVETIDEWIYYMSNETQFTSHGYTYEKRQSTTETFKEGQVFVSLKELQTSVFGDLDG